MTRILKESIIEIRRVGRKTDIKILKLIRRILKRKGEVKIDGLAKQSERGVGVEAEEKVIIGKMITIEEDDGNDGSCYN